MQKYKHFLFLGLKTEPIRDSKYPKGFISYPDTFPDDNVTFSVVLTKGTEQKDDGLSLGMILISSNRALGVGESLHYAHAIEALRPINSFCIAHILHDCSLFPISNKSYKNLGRPWKFNEIAEKCRVEIAGYYSDSSFFLRDFGSYAIESLSRIEHIIPYLKAYTIDPCFQIGCSYLFSSMRELGIDVCDWREEEYDTDFHRFVSISKAESAFLNGFKVIESIVGEPGKKERGRQKLIKKLEEHGIDPEESVGYRVKEKPIRKILKYQRLRDRIAAHGIQKTKRKLHLSEIIDLQSLARYLLLSSVRRYTIKT